MLNVQNPERACQPGRRRAVFWAIGFPVAGLIVLGLIPAADKPVAGLGGISVLQTYLPIIITFTLVMTAVNFLPTTLVSYRERGVLRRMFTTPVKPRTLLAAQILLNLAVQVATVALTVILAVGAFGATIGQPLGFIIAFITTAAAVSAVGLLVAAVCFTGKAANAVGRQRRERGGHHHRRPGRPARRDRSDPAASGSGGAGQRGQARGGQPGRDHAVLHGRYSHPGRQGRRRRLSAPRPGPASRHPGRG
jgi:hypothetical protein